MVFLPINKKQFAVSCIIGLICCVGNKNSRFQSNELSAAICDNVTHALIGAFTYIGAYITKTSNTNFYFLLEIVFCAICSSLIDIDHFVAAKSMHLKDAISLKNRPLMHCTTLVILIISVVLLLSYIVKSSWMCKFGWILTAAFISHHIRDSERRGFWLWPFGHTMPIPSVICVAAQMFYPQLLAVIISKFSPLAMPKEVFSTTAETV